MAIQIVDNFQVNIAKAIDNRLVVGPGQFYTNKDSLPYKYAGMRVWDLNVNIPYVWDGATFSTEAASSVSGSGTANYIPKFVSPGNVIQNSIIYDNATNVGIGTITPDKKLTVNGDIRSMTGFGFYGNGSQITNINASYITSGELLLTRLQNTSQTGSILVSGLAQPVYTLNMTVDSAPVVNSTIPGVITTLYFKNFSTTKIYSYHNPGEWSELFIETGSTELKLSSGYIQSNVPIRVPYGSQATPSLSFTSDSDTGIYRSGTNQLGFTTGGVLRTYISSTVLLSYVGIQSLVDIFASAAGSAASPSIKVGMTNMGLYREVANKIAISAGGIKRMSISSSGIQMVSPVTSVIGSYTVPTTAAASPDVNDINIPSVDYDRIIYLTSGNPYGTEFFNAAGWLDVEIFIGFNKIYYNLAKPDGVMGAAERQMMVTKFNHSFILPANVGGVVKFTRNSGFRANAGNTIVYYVSSYKLGL